MLLTKPPEDLGDKTTLFLLSHLSGHDSLNLSIPAGCCSFSTDNDDDIAVGLSIPLAKRIS